MKTPKFLSALFSIVLLTITCTAIGATVQPTTHYIGIGIDELYCSVVTPAIHTGTTVAVHFASLFEWAISGLQSLFNVVQPTGLMAMGVTAYTAAAKDTNMVLDKIRNTFPGIPMQDITTSTLRAEQVITDSDSTYEFIFNVNRRTGTTIQPTEILLDQNNIFIPYSVEMYLAAVDATKPSAVRLQTYPNNQVFATEAGGTIYDYYIFYNSLLSIKTGKETNPPISTHYFLKMPVTAQSSATTTSDNESGRPELWLSELPFFFGLANQSVFLNTTTFAGIDVAADTASWDTRIVLILNGFIIYNGTDYANSDVQKNSPELYNAIVQAKNAGSLSF